MTRLPLPLRLPLRRAAHGPPSRPALHRHASSKPESTAPEPAPRLDAHVLVGTSTPPSSWPRRVESDAELVPLPLPAVAPGPRLGRMSVSVTLVHVPEGTETRHWAFSRWGHAKSTTERARLEAVLRASSREEWEAEVRSSEWVDASEPLWLVCAHGTRDERCGRCGPPVMQALRDAGSKLVLGCSHVGGHRFAANVLSYPSGEWFSLVTPANARDVVLGHKPSSFVARGSVWRS